MQRQESYGQMPTGVKTRARQRGGQIHRTSVRVGAQRIRISGDFATIMSWVRLALAEREAHA